jgi:hypothetical protein
VMLPRSQVSFSISELPVRAVINVFGADTIGEQDVILAC